MNQPNIPANEGTKILTAEELSMIRGALDSLGVVLTDYEHTWTEGEKEIYEQAIKLLS